MTPPPPPSLTASLSSSDSHGTAGAAVAVSRLGSALAIAMMVGGSASGTPPIGRVPWSRLDAHCEMDTVSFGSGMQPRSSGARALP